MASQVSTGNGVVPDFIVGFDFGLSTISVSFMVPKKGKQHDPAPVNQWPSADDARKETVPL
jgi:hypothetical protein